METIVNIRQKYEQIEIDKTYSLSDIAEMMEIDLQTVIEWKTLGALNENEDQIFKMKCFTFDGQNYVFGKDLMQFLDDIDL